MSRGISCLRTVLLLVSLAGFSLPGALAQSTATPQSPAPPASPGAETPADADQQYSIAVEIGVVTVPVTVTDAAGEFVTDMDKSDFTVLDNGARQKIEEFELSLEPLSLVVVIETSSRIQSLLPEGRKSGILFTQLIVGESGEAAVLTFDRDLKLAQDFTSDADRIEQALRNLQAGRGPGRRRGG